MSHFHPKNFNGVHYALEHLDPFTANLTLDAAATIHVDVHVVFGCHCFTEAFDASRHQDHHRYTFQGEMRAFEVQRHACSLQLRAVIACLFKGRIHRGDGSYTYVASITLGDAPGALHYSVFFSLEREAGNSGNSGNGLKLFVKSAYLKPLVAGAHAQSWRFVALAGEISGLFVKTPKPRPRKSRP